jgi:hypothetical protein
MEELRIETEYEDYRHEEGQLLVDYMSPWSHNEVMSFAARGEHVLARFDGQFAEFKIVSATEMSEGVVIVTLTPA